MKYKNRVKENLNMAAAPSGAEHLFSTGRIFFNIQERDY